MIGPFGQRQPTDALGILQAGKWTCRTCKQPHTGAFDLACHRPDPWNGDDRYEPNSAIRLDGDFLSEDFCVIGGEHFMVRCVLEIPVHGLKGRFAFGCWGSLKREDFEIYLEHFDSGTLPDNLPWFSWLVNDLGCFETTEPLACWMSPRSDRQRPVLEVDAPDHPLARAQTDGISPEELLEIYACHGHVPVS